MARPFTREACMMPYQQFSTTTRGDHPLPLACGVTTAFAHLHHTATQTQRGHQYEPEQHTQLLEMPSTPPACAYMHTYGLRASVHPFSQLLLYCLPPFIPTLLRKGAGAHIETTSCQRRGKRHGCGAPRPQPQLQHNAQSQSRCQRITPSQHFAVHRASNIHSGHTYAAKKHTIT